MRAVVVEALAPDYAGVAIRDIPMPEPGPGEVLVKVRAAAVNFPDLLQTRGEYQHRPALPFVAGMEAAGEVVAVGEGTTFRIGDRVVGSGRPESVTGSGGPGAFCEYAVMATPRVMPATMTFSQAAAFGTAYLTAYVSLVRRGDMKRGDWVLVHGAAGGVGMAAVDLAKALGARVIAAGASDDKLAVVEGCYHPDAVVNVTGGFKDRVKEITGGAGADIIYDPVGGDVFDESVRCIAFNGRLLSIGYASGRIPTLPVNMALIKGFSLVGVRAGEYGRRFPLEGVRNQNFIWQMAAEGSLTPRIHAEVPLDRWREAYDLLADRQVIGKAIIRPDL
jgi:NADPH2:quinone reductase